MGAPAQTPRPGVRQQPRPSYSDAKGLLWHTLPYTTTPQEYGHPLRTQSLGDNFKCNYPLNFSPMFQP